MKKTIGIFMHGGSGNRGCEAILKTTLNMLPEDYQKLLFSARETEDNSLEFDNYTVNSQGKEWPPSGINRIKVKVHALLTKDKFPYVMHRYSKLINHIDECDVWISIGGDNYCYPALAEQMINLIDMIKRKNKKVILWGCSIEPEYLENPENIQHLKLYDHIFIRESITYAALQKAGFSDTISLNPDPAFTLKPTQYDIPEQFSGKQAIGINVSPLILGYENKDLITLKNYHTLIDYIIKQTSYPIILIPHVFWEHSNDWDILERIYDQYKSTKRFFFPGKLNSQQLKSIISDLRLFIGARTHATIAAYSSKVPTLVVGYSVKAKGIAKDIFGTYENYVISVQSFNVYNQLLEKYLWVEENYNSIKKVLEVKIPPMIIDSLKAKDKLHKIIIGEDY